MIFDLRKLNAFLKECPFQYATLRRSRAMFKPNDWLFSFDLSSAYHHVGLKPEEWKYFGFRWRGVEYVFIALPFGLSTAPFAFTKLMRQLVNKWTREGRRVMQYIDDGLFAVSGKLTQEEAMAEAQSVLADLQAAGWKVNLTKSFGHCAEAPPVHRCVALGMVIDTAKGVFEVTDKRKGQIAAQAASLLDAAGPVLVREVDYTLEFRPRTCAIQGEVVLA